MSDVDPILHRLTEDEDEEADLGKDVGDTYPHFDYEPFGSAYNNYITLVKVQGEFIGSLTEKKVNPPEWYISFVAPRKLRTHVPVRSSEEGAQKLWQDRLGIIELPEIQSPYEPLPPLEGDPDHYEGLKSTAKTLVNFLAEDQESSVSNLPKPVRLLQQAGFKIVESVENTVTFSWPADNQATYFNGIRRAREVLKSCTITEARRKNDVAELTATFK